MLKVQIQILKCLYSTVNYLNMFIINMFKIKNNVNSKLNKTTNR